MYLHLALHCYNEYNLLSFDEFHCDLLIRINNHLSFPSIRPKNSYFVRTVLSKHCSFLTCLCIDLTLLDP
uniref:Putative ovule protein n=1 Tax=Solanum chacoense TaxID=4108 RepID=A0A0V0GN69_SOLCH